MSTINFPLHAFRAVPRTGVIFVTTAAAEYGYKPGSEEWTNFGQGMPETGPLPQAPQRISHINIAVDDHEYAPVSGILELREAIAHLYNSRYRQGRGSRYSAANVSVCGGGRMALTRTAAALGRLNLGHFLPDYTAYEELLDIFRFFIPIPILLEEHKNYQFSVDDLRREMLGRGLGAILLSNPSNPTGKLIAGDLLDSYIQSARDLDCALIFDEFYSNYIWQPPFSGSSVSAAQYVKNVNEDPVVIIDGLTKNWRYPGWRLSWIVAPESVIEAVSSAGSFLDGGGSRPLQRAAIPLLEPAHADTEMKAIQKAFTEKKQLLLKGLRELGIRVADEPAGTFYIWGDVSKLPAEINDGMSFFYAALNKKVITVPGEFFDVDPGQRRSSHPSFYRSHVRFSFGPDVTSIRRGLKNLQELLASFT